MKLDRLGDSLMERGRLFQWSGAAQAKFLILEWDVVIRGEERRRSLDERRGRAGV